METKLISSVLILLSILSLFILPYAPIVNYTVTFIASSAFFLLLAIQIFRVEISQRTIFISIAASLIVRLIFINITPIGSDDIYRYLWDGKVQAHGINPYKFAPNDSALDHLSSKQTPALVNHADMKTMYFPLSEWIFLASYSLSREEVWGYKTLLFLSDILTLCGLYLLMKKLQIPLKFILLYALCPMLIYEYAIDAHVDGFGLPLLVFSLYFYFSGRKLLSLFLLGFSLSIKPVGLIILPLLFFTEKNWKIKTQILLIPVLVLIFHFIPYTIDSNPFEALFDFTKNWTFNGFVFNILNLYYNDNQKSRLICAIVLTLVVFILSLSKKDNIDKIYFAFLFLLLFSPIVHPWYVGWLAVLLPVARKWSGIIYVSTLSFTSFTYISYQLHGVWKEDPIQWLLVYLPVVMFTVIELMKGLKYFRNRWLTSS